MACNSSSVITGVIERWELLQAQDLSKEIRTKQNQQQWQQLNSDLNNVWAWLGATEEELEEQRRLDLCTDIEKIEQRIKKLKVLSFAFCFSTTGSYPTRSPNWTDCFLFAS